MKYWILSLSIMIAFNITAQKTTRINAVKSNDFGVIYSLPKTSFEITLLVKKTIYRKGEFYPYAQRYLGIDHPIVEDKTVYSLENIKIINKGIVDKQNSFMVEFSPKTFEPYVCLREDGVIAAVNADPEPEVDSQMQIPEKETPSVNPRSYLSQEALMAGSTAKQAELVARQIFDLRNSRRDILTGEADNMPPDGNAYKVVMDEIDLQEKALTELFAGSTETDFFVHSFTIVPEETNIDKKIIIRFSSKLGPVDADDLAGEPIYFSLINKTPKQETQLSEKELERFQKKLNEGLIYNIPGKADLSIEFQNKILVTLMVDVVQFGSKDVLVRKMFDNMKKPIKIYFYPELGAIRQIIQ